MWVWVWGGACECTRVRSELNCKGKQHSARVRNIFHCLVYFSAERKTRPFLSFQTKTEWAELRRTKSTLTGEIHLRSKDGTQVNHTISTSQRPRVGTPRWLHMTPSITPANPKTSAKAPVHVVMPRKPHMPVMTSTIARALVTILNVTTNLKLKYVTRTLRHWQA